MKSLTNTVKFATVMFAVLAAAASLSAPSFAKNRQGEARADYGQLVHINSEPAFDPFHQTGFNGNH